jgi:hypothetical protein
MKFSMVLRKSNREPNQICSNVPTALTQCLMKVNRLEIHAKDKQNSLLRTIKNYGRKTFCKIGPWGHQICKSCRCKCNLRFVHKRDVDQAILLSDAISIEILKSFQIATADDSDNV